MNRHEEGASGDPVLAGHLVYDLEPLMDAAVCRHPPVSARPLCRVKGIWSRDQQEGRTPNRLGPQRGHGAGCPSGQTLSRSDCSMDSMRVEMTHVWNTPGNLAARVHSGGNVWSTINNLRQLTMVILLPSKGAKRFLVMVVPTLAKFDWAAGTTRTMLSRMLPPALSRAQTRFSAVIVVICAYDSDEGHSAAAARATARGRSASQ